MFYRFTLKSKKNEVGKRKLFLLIFCHRTENFHVIFRIKLLKTTLYTIFNSCFRYLATGDSHQTIVFSFRVGRSTVSNIVKEVCQELWNVLQPLYLPTPTEETWTQTVTGFKEIWEFPNCLGSIDGKHVKLKCPSSSGSNYFC